MRIFRGETHINQILIEKAGKEGKIIYLVIKSDKLANPVGENHVEITHVRLELVNKLFMLLGHAGSFGNAKRKI